MTVETSNQRIAKLEVRVSTHDKNIQKLQEDNVSLTRLATLVEMQMEVNKEVNKTLEKINENLTNLNNTQQSLKTEVSQIGNKVEELEKKADERKIDGGKLFKEVVFKVIPLLVGAWLLFKFGLK